MLQVKAAQHTLTCSACGAPLGQLKMLPTPPPVAEPAITHQPAVAKFKAKPKPAYAKLSKPSKKRKKRESLFRKFAEEVFDFVEDILD